MNCAVNLWRLKGQYPKRLVAVLLAAIGILTLVAVINRLIHRPKYDVLPSYGPFPGYGCYPYGGGVFGSGYPVGGYGMAAVSPRIPWGGPAMVTMSGGPLPMTVYPGYLNGGHGLMGMSATGYNGIMGPAASGMPSQLSGGSEQLWGTVDNNSLGSTGGEARKNDQSGVGGNME